MSSDKQIFFYAGTRDSLIQELRAGHRATIRGDASEPNDPIIFGSTSNGADLYHMLTAMSRKVLPTGEIEYLSETFFNLIAKGKIISKEGIQSDLSGSVPIPIGSGQLSTFTAEDLTGILLELKQLSTTGWSRNTDSSGGEVKDKTYYLVDTSSGDINYTQPSTPVEGFSYQLIKVSADNNIVSDGVDTILYLGESFTKEYVEGGWVTRQDGRGGQTASNTVTDTTTESISETANTQQDINRENKSKNRQQDSRLDGLAIVDGALSIDSQGITTTPTKLTWTVFDPSDDTDILDFDDPNDFILYKNNELGYKASATFTVLNDTTTDLDMTLEMVDSVTDQVILDQNNNPRVLTETAYGKSNPGDAPKATPMSLPAIKFTFTDPSISFYYRISVNSNSLSIPTGGVAKFETTGGGAVSRPSQGVTNELNTADGNEGWLATGYTFIAGVLKKIAGRVESYLNETSWNVNLDGVDYYSLSESIASIVHRVRVSIQGGTSSVTLDDTGAIVDGKLLSTNTDLATGPKEYIKSGEVYNSIGLLTGAGSTANRPTTGLYTGRPYFDTDLGYQINYNGSAWVNMTGMVV